MDSSCIQVKTEAGVSQVTQIFMLYGNLVPFLSESIRILKIDNGRNIQTALCSRRLYLNHTMVGFLDETVELHQNMGVLYVGEE